MGDRFRNPHGRGTPSQDIIGSDDPRFGTIVSLQDQFKSGGRLGRDDPALEPPPRRITPGSLFGLRGRGGEFGIGDLQDRKALSDYAGAATGKELGWGPGQEEAILAAVNELAAEWQMAPFAKLEEISPEFIDRLEGMLR